MRIYSRSNPKVCVAVLADGRFVTGSEDTTVKVWKESSPGSGVWSVEATLFLKCTTTSPGKTCDKYK